jgi:hypothetical protein
MYIRKSKPVTLVNKPKEENLNSECIIVIIDPDQPSNGEAITTTVTPSKPTISQQEPLPAVVINEKTLVFRMDSRTLWTKYALGLVN